MTLKGLIMKRKKKKNCDQGNTGPCKSMQLVSVITVHVSLVTELLMLCILMFLTLMPRILCFFWIKIHRTYNTADYTDNYLTCLLTMFCLSVNSNTKVWQTAAWHSNTGLRHTWITGGLLLTFKQWHTKGRVGLGGLNPPPRNSEGPPKSCQTQPDCENC